jgi:glycosyltransferase involved in cell wall biosynthesis
MKVLFFIESLRAGGKERRIVELLKGLIEYKDISVELVLTRKEIHYPEIFQLGLPIHIIERKFLKKDPLVFFKFFHLAKKFNPDIIHVWGHMVAVYAVPSKWILKVPLLNSEITDATPNQKLLAKSIVFKASDRIIANTQAGLLAYKAPPSKSGVIFNGFNFQRLAKLEDLSNVRDRFGIKTDYVIAMVASFIEYKDWNTYLKAALLLTKKRGDVTFLCIGDGDDSLYRKMVSESLTDKILFLGKQTRIESIMNICSIGVLTTNIKNHGEGISNALMEFMALGKPVIATNFGGSVELIEPGVSGYLIDPYSHTQLGYNIEYLLENSAERERLGKGAEARVKRNFSIGTMVSNFYSEYISLYKQGR